MKGSRALLQLLEDRGVDTIFGYPGGSVIPIFDELLESSIRDILVRHEQCAAHMADGYARALGRPGVCLATSGPGATNLVTGVATAYADSSPMMVLTGQVVSGALGMGAFQEVDCFSLMMPITKHNYRLLDTAQLPKAVSTGWQISQTGRPGPVHIDLPLDTINSEVDEALLKTEYPPVTVKEDLSQIPLAAELIMKAERPLILAGGGVIGSNASPELVALAEMIWAPVVTSLMGIGAIPDGHPLALGFPGMHGRTGALRALNETDLLIAVGSRFSDRTFSKHTEIPPDAKVIHIEIDPVELGKHSQTAARILSDAKKGLQALLTHLRSYKRDAWALRIESIKRQCCCDTAIDQVPICPQRVMHEINKILDDKTIITTEVGQNQMWAAHFLKIRRSRQFISSGGFGTMGFGFPAAIGAKVAKPDHKIIDVAGDGSLLMVIQELATAVAEDLPVTVCLLNNGWLGMVKQWQKLFWGERYSGTRLRGMPDFVALAKSFGADGVHVDRPSEIAEGLKRGLESDVPFIVDIKVDPEEDILPMLPPDPTLPPIMGRCRFGQQ
ncbi:MAG: acetolactate synthase large subunit [Candidatus Methanomethylophilaceae archaeon]|nr:acetolactate synthase large subunit [Candidatus Methanomethylophilaceae archaeon]MDI3541543.1 acetolactate synthase large subunit [Candidatus Methanomethylophilaceae archaeon]